MGETTNNTEQSPKKSWFKGLKSEFKKVIWPDKNSLMKQSSAVLLASIVLGVFIAALDLVVKYGIGFIIK